jgi:hypothetical protein
MTTRTLGPRARATITLAASLALTACSNGGGGTGGPVTGPADAHCGAKVQTTSQASCHLTSDAGADPYAGSGVDYGPTLDNAEGDDDDCKYHLTWSADGIAENQDVTLTVVATNKSDGSPVVGAVPKGYSMAEVFLNDLHPAPNTDQGAPESPPGTYAVGPLRFDAPGKWTVRFHLFEDCTDLAEDSPHGHAAFYVQVP